MVVALLSFILAGQILLTGSRSIISRPMWFDELMTYRLAADPNLGHAMDAFRSGVETAPPARLLLLRIFCALTGGVDESRMRIFSILGALAAMAGAYLLARRLCNPLAALVAALAVGTHPLLIEQQFQCRFYANQVSFAIWFYIALLWSKPAGAWKLLRMLSLAAMAALVCTMHYFGIFSLSLIVCADAIFDRRPWRRKFINLLPTLAGPAALLVCLPIYFSQKAALSIPTWISPADVAQTLDYFRDLLAALPIAIVLIAYFISTTFSKKPEENHNGASGASEIAGLLGLLLLPAVVWAFSILIQPALLTKYAIDTVAGFVPVAALFASRLNRGLAMICLVILIAMGGAETVVQFQYNQRYVDSTNSLISALRSITDAREPILFAHTDEFCAVSRYAPELTPRCYFLDFEVPKASDHPPTPFMIVERDVQRPATKFYPDYQMATLKDLNARSRFILVAFTQDLPIIQAMDPTLAFHRLPSGLIEGRRAAR
jgi:uncharacterized membrane protein